MSAAGSEHMPHFHLNVFDDIEAYDREGIQCPNIEEAKGKAIAGARELVATSIIEGKPIYRSHRIEITNGCGEVLDTVRFADIVDLRP